MKQQRLSWFVRLPELERITASVFRAATVPPAMEQVCAFSSLTSDPVFNPGSRTTPGRGAFHDAITDRSPFALIAADRGKKLRFRT